MRWDTGIAAAAGIVGMSSALATTGCAALFREGKTTLHVESDPSGGKVALKDVATATPAEVPVSRGGITEVRVTMPGFEEHHGLVRKHVNGFWVTVDVATCVVPLLLCIPLLVDAISGAWNDVDARYHAQLVPMGLGGLAPSYGEDGALRMVRRGAPPPLPTASAASSTGTQPSPPTATPSSMSESERKASARAAYQEGMELQAQKSWPEALARFQTAQRTFDAPTHLLQIAECLVMTGKLVEAQETYETLAHRDRELGPGAPGPFRDAVETGKRELADLQPRIPTLRIEVRPAPATLRNLALSMNGRPIPPEVIGIARPVNPGTYRITATAWGIPPARPVDVTLAEKDARTVEVKLGR
jgi:hypothetical protein